MWFILLTVISAVLPTSGGLTRYTCITSPATAGLVSSEEESRTTSMTGTLSCSSKPNSKILVTRIIHGYGNFRGCANPDEACDKEIYSDTTVASHCDGKISCIVQSFPKWLDKCSLMSDFVHVEYECIFDSSIFDICRETSINVKDASVFVVSPNVFKGSGPESVNPSLCECIINSRYSDQIIADYIHSDVYASGERCTDSYILIESKMFPNQTAVDKEVEVCGRRTVSNQMFRGSVRITYHNRKSSADDGFLTKFRVPPLDIGAEIGMQCGPVRSSGGSYDKKRTPPPRGPGYNSFRGSSMMPNHRQSIWGGGFYSNIPPYIPTQVPFFDGPPVFDPPGWRNPGSHGNGQFPPPPWENPSSTGQRSNFGPLNSNRNVQDSDWNNPNAQWSREPRRNAQNDNDPTLQNPRDPRMFSNTIERHARPTANQLGVTIDPESLSRTGNSPIDPRIANANKNNQRRDFIPWTNSNKSRRRKDFIPWTPLRTNKTMTREINVADIDSKIRISGHGSLQTEKTSTTANTVMTKSQLPTSVQFLGEAKTQRTTVPVQAENKSKEHQSVSLQMTANTDQASEKGRELAFIVGGVGAGLIGLCSVAFFFMCAKRRRLRNAQKKNDEERNSSGISDDPIYALPSDVSFHSPDHAHDNEAYSEDQLPTEIISEDETATIDELSDDMCNDQVFTTDLQATQTYNEHTNAPFYDNNITPCS